MDTSERMYSLAEASRLTGISYSTLRRRVDAGQLAADTSNPKRYRIPARALAGLVVVDPRDAAIADLRRRVELLERDIRQMRLRGLAGWPQNAPRFDSEGAGAHERSLDVVAARPVESPYTHAQEPDPRDEGMLLDRQWPRVSSFADQHGIAPSTAVRWAKVMLRDGRTDLALTAPDPGRPERGAFWLTAEGQAALLAYHAKTHPDLLPPA